MIFISENAQISNTDHAVLDMSDGDRVHIGFRDNKGEFQVINVCILYGEATVSHEQSDKTMRVAREE